MWRIRFDGPKLTQKITDKNHAVDIVDLGDIGKNFNTAQKWVLQWWNFNFRLSRNFPIWKGKASSDWLLLIFSFFVVLMICGTFFHFFCKNYASLENYYVSSLQFVTSCLSLISIDLCSCTFRLQLLTTDLIKTVDR